MMSVLLKAYLLRKGVYMGNNKGNVGNHHIKSFLECESISVDELLDTEFPPQKWLVDKLIPAGALTVIFGEGGVYKTRLTLNIMLSAINEKPWLDKFNTSKASILYINEENKPSLVKEMLTQLGATRGLPIRIRSLQNFKIIEEYLFAILDECKKNAINVVVFDPLVHMLNGISENDSVAMAELMKLFQILTNEDITVIILHHARKPSMYGFGSGHHAMRGSTAIYDAADCVIGITLKNELLTNSHHKSRADLPIAPFTLRVETPEDRSTLKFIYNSTVSSKTKKEENEEKVMDRIVRAVSGHKPHSQAEILELIKNEGLKINEHSLRDNYLPKLLEEKLIYKIDGPKNTHYYRAANASALIPTLQVTTNLSTGKRTVKKVAIF